MYARARACIYSRPSSTEYTANHLAHLLIIEDEPPYASPHVREIRSSDLGVTLAGSLGRRAMLDQVLSVEREDVCLGLSIALDERDDI